MSKMPGKRSCFQITSVTQAQVAGNCLPDDTESQDDLDESRTGDMPPEGFDVCRVDQGACATNCSEEISHYGGDSLPNKALVNGGFYLKSLASGRLTPGMPASNFAASSMLTSVTQTAPSNSYSSRFRVIKLDHGTGEPFRRGRWNCTEFYERDSDSNLTVDSLKSAGSLDYTDRDSVLGATSNSFVSSSTSSAQGLESTTDSGYFASVGHPSHSYHSESHQQDYRLSPRKGSGASAFLPTGLNGVHPGSRQQMPPSIPPASQAQQLDYSAHPTGLSDYHQQQFSSGALTSSVASSSGHVSSPQISSPGPAKRRLSSETGSAPTVIAPIHTQQQPVSQPQVPGGLGIALPLFSTTSSNSGGQNVPVSMPSATSIPQGVSDPMSSSHGAAVHQPEDSRQKVDVLPQHISTVARQDGMRTPITDGFDMQRSTVKNLFNIQISMDVDDDSASGASAVAIDNKIEQAMDLVKSHLMYAVREEVEVLKEQIKELYERNSMLERENAVLKSLANTEQLSQLTGQTSNSSTPVQQLHHLPLVANSPASLLHLEGSPSIPHQPNISSA
uniref:TSC22 domain family protein 2 n=1 Tax=Oryzias latipes TaxID=8090 RepID=A0A3P9HWU0_ORYLA